MRCYKEKTQRPAGFSSYLISLLKNVWRVRVGWTPYCPSHPQVLLLSLTFKQHFLKTFRPSHMTAHSPHLSSELRGDGTETHLQPVWEKMAGGRGRTAEALRLRMGVQRQESEHSPLSPSIPSTLLSPGVL